MKRLSHHFNLFLAVAVFLGVSLTAAAPVRATWFWTHGHSGKIENLDVTNWSVTNNLAWGWGLAFTLDDSSRTWAHYAVPTIGNRRKVARYIKINFKTGSNDAWISAVDVWNGGDRLERFLGLVEFGGPKTITLDLGRKVNFSRGMGVSIEVTSGSNPDSHVIDILGVGANFVKK